MSDINIPPTKLPPIWVVNRQIDRAKIYFLEGIQQQADCNHTRALYLFKKALKRDGDFVVADYWAVWSNIALGKYPEAIDALRVCIIKFDALQKSIELFNEEQVGGDRPTQEFLCSLYENLILFNALLVKMHDPVFGDRLLVEYLDNDQTLPKELKGKEIVVRGLMGDQSLIVRSKEGTRTVGPQELFETCLNALYINMAQNIVNYFSELEDYVTIKNLFLKKIEIIDEQKVESPRLMKLKRALQINLARALLEMRETEESRNILERVLQQIPDDQEVHQLLEKLNSLN